MTRLAWANVERVSAGGVLRAKAGPVEVVSSDYSSSALSPYERDLAPFTYLGVTPPPAPPSCAVFAPPPPQPGTSPLLLPQPQHALSVPTAAATPATAVTAPAHPTPWTARPPMRRPSPPAPSLGWCGTTAVPVGGAMATTPAMDGWPPSPAGVDTLTEPPWASAPGEPLDMWVPLSAVAAGPPTEADAPARVETPPWASGASLAPGAVAIVAPPRWGAATDTAVPTSAVGACPLFGGGGSNTPPDGRGERGGPWWTLPASPSLTTVSPSVAVPRRSAGSAAAAAATAAAASERPPPTPTGASYVPMSRSRQWSAASGPAADGWVPPHLMGRLEGGVEAARPTASGRRRAAYA